MKDLNSNENFDIAKSQGFWFWITVITLGIVFFSLSKEMQGKIVLPVLATVVVGGIAFISFGGLGVFSESDD